MQSDAVSIPHVPDGSQLLIIRQLLDSQRIAIVGLSDDPSKPSHRVAAYLKEMGKEIVPVIPATKRCSD